MHNLYRAVAPCIGVCILVAVFVRLKTEDGGSETGNFAATGWGLAFLLFSVVLGVVTILFRRTRPDVMIVVEFLEILSALFVGSDPESFSQLLAFFGVYLCIWAPTGLQIICDVLSIVVIGTRCVWPYAPAGVYYSVVFIAMAVLAMGVSVYRIVDGRRGDALEVKRLKHASQVLGTQRDEAIDQSRMAAELHDSVGHGLTVIIAFSQGLEDLLRRRGQLDDEAAQAINGIEQIARESLGNTRSMLERLNGSKDVGDNAYVESADGSAGSAMDSDLRDSAGESGVQADPDGLHRWDDVRPIFDRIRALGIVLVFMETGKRPESRTCADLVFRVTRECITNALRHAEHLTRISVSWDHGQASTVVTVRNDGISSEDVDRLDRAKNAGRNDGTGLRILEGALASHGGSLTVRASDGQWDVRATVPTAEGKA